MLGEITDYAKYVIEKIIHKERFFLWTIGTPKGIRQIVIVVNSQILRTNGEGSGGGIKAILCEITTLNKDHDWMVY